MGRLSHTPLVVSYGDARAQCAELLVPDFGDAHPVCVLIHGGFWRARYNKTLMQPLADHLVARGWATWNLEYRRIGRLSGGGWPQTFEDVGAGIDKLADVAGEHKLELSRVVAAGHSAGGHLALWAAGRRDPGVRLAGVVSQGGVDDLHEADRLALGAAVTRRLMGGAPSGDEAAWREADPMCRLPTGVPALLIHGEQDETVPPALAERYAAAAREAGDEVDLDIRPGEGHFEHIDPGSAAWAATVAWMTKTVANAR